jgi:hypothetical protein
MCSQAWTVKRGTAEITRLQLPIDFGWGVSVHKAASLVFKSGTICVNDSWASGQAFTALTSFSDLDKVRLICGGIPSTAAEGSSERKSFDYVMSRAFWVSRSAAQYADSGSTVQLSVPS